MADLVFAVLRALSDGKFHSGEAIAHALGCSRTLIWHAVQKIEQELGIEVFSVRGQGYKLAYPFEFLDVASIRSRLALSCADFWTIAVAERIDSTNTQLLTHATADSLNGLVLAAEMQTHGRGRLGRRWQASMGDCLMFSILWRFERSITELAGLSLAVGLALAQVLRAEAVPVTLKWPNDILLHGAKLAGILIELSGDALGPATVVIGVGLNMRAPLEIDQPVASLAEYGALQSRNSLLAMLLNNVYRILSIFDQKGFAPFVDDWIKLSAHQDQAIELRFSHGDSVQGIARGVEQNGALIVDLHQGRKIFHIGEVSLRCAQ